MATKAEMEVELIRLRQELEEARAASRAAPEEAGDAAPEAAGGEIQAETAAEIIADLEALAARKPLAAALGAFVIGVLVGRAASR